MFYGHFTPIFYQNSIRAIFKAHYKSNHNYLDIRIYYLVVEITDCMAQWLERRAQ
jgi:hypothetical protein